MVRRAHGQLGLSSVMLYRPFLESVELCFIAPIIIVGTRILSGKVLVLFLELYLSGSWAPSPRIGTSSAIKDDCCMAVFLCFRMLYTVNFGNETVQFRQTSE